MCEDLELYALYALEKEEMDAFERHLESCSVCQQKLPELLSTAAQLAMLAPEVKPPARLKMKVLAIPAQEEERARQAQGTNVVALRPRRTRALLAAVAIAASFVLGGVVFTATNNEDAPVVAPRVTPASQLQLIQDSEDASMVMHRMKKGSLRVDYSRKLDAGVIEAKNMPELRGTEVYQLWMKHTDGTLSPAVTLGDGTQMAAMNDLKSVVGIGITKEPSPGAKVPTSTPLAMIAL